MLLRFEVRINYGNCDSMSDAEAFIQEVRANPGDETPRLIYADFLEEQGDPRGEFIRIQVELAATAPGDVARGPLLKREQELLDLFGEEWLEPLRRLGVDGVSRACFHGGLLEKVRMTADRFIKNGAELCDVEPALHRVQLHKVRPVYHDFVQLALPEQVQELDLTANQLGTLDLESLIAAPWAGHVRSLVLSFNQLGNDGLVQILAGAWPKLKSLTLDANQLTDPGMRALRRSQLYERLESVSLKANDIDQNLLPAAK